MATVTGSVGVYTGHIGCEEHHSTMTS